MTSSKRDLHVKFNLSVNHTGFSNALHRENINLFYIKLCILLIGTVDRQVCLFASLFRADQSFYSLLQILY